MKSRGEGHREDQRLVEKLRKGDEAAFTALVELHGSMMFRIALIYVRSPAVAEDVVQDAWVGILEGIERFEARSSLKTWMLRIVKNIAIRRAQKERRSASAFSLGDEDTAPSVSAERFRPEKDRWAGHWRSTPHDWSDLPEERLLGQETLMVVQRAIASLPPSQRATIHLRDVLGFSSEEVCALLEVSEQNQRVLLHRARSKLRDCLEEHFAGI